MVIIAFIVMMEILMVLMDAVQIVLLKLRTDVLTPLMSIDPFVVINILMI